MKVVKDHGKYRRGMILTMGYVEAMVAGLKGWAVPAARYDTATRMERETR